MSDPRLTPTNGRVAAVSLRGTVAAERFVEGEAARIIRAVADLRSDPADPGRARQLLFGEAVTVFERRAGAAFVQSARDGHVGYVAEDALGAPSPASHVVAVRASHAYGRADIKGAVLTDLSFGTQLTVTGRDGTLSRTADGHFVPSVHLREIGVPFDDPVAVAEMMLGVPYLWGGNSHRGLDCSGLVQMAWIACGRACPPDSDLQQALGQPLGEDAPLVRGDLVFWRGHVAIAVDGETLIHANAAHMAVTVEPLAAVVARIEAMGGGAVTARRRC